MYNYFSLCYNHIVTKSQNPIRKRGICMKKSLKSLTGFVLSAIMLVAMSTTAFASETLPNPNPKPVTTPVSIDADLESMDFTKPFSDTTVVYDDNGKPITMTLNFVPAPQARGSSTNDASAGTWTSEVDYGIIQMSYKFDLAKSGSQWKMSNGREHQYRGLFCKFSNDSLKISRATSTNTYPCEINAKVDADVFDNAWIPLYSGTWLMTTTVSSGGKMTLTWN